jgi:peroxiredoxin Q/BCP
VVVIVLLAAGVAPARLLYSRIVFRRVLVASIALIAAAVSGARGAELAPGAKAPGFTLVGTDGRTYRLADFVGRQGFVLAWFPKAFTSG